MTEDNATLRGFQSDILSVVSTGKSEAERAALFKERARTHMIALCVLMDEALREGLMIRWQNVALNPWGWHEVVDLHIEKQF